MIQWLLVQKIELLTRILLHRMKFYVSLGLKKKTGFVAKSLAYMPSRM